MSIREVQIEISDTLKTWADIMLDIEAHEKAHLLHYNEKDLVNTMYIFEHVLSNIAIHNGADISAFKGGSVVFYKGIRHKNI